MSPYHSLALRARGLAVVLLSLAVVAVGAAVEAKIDRKALVTRHNPKVTRVDPWAPLSVGNGQFAFTTDVTGLQTFYDHYYENGIPLETQARWAWHANANQENYTLADASRAFTNYGRTISYPMSMNSPAGKWLRENPHPMPLPQIALEVSRPGGAALKPDEIRDIQQTLDLWSGILTSSYAIDGAPVKVTVAARPRPIESRVHQSDVLAIRIESPLVAANKLAVRIALPRGHDLSVKNNPRLDWSQPESHTTRIHRLDTNRTTVTHVRDDSSYLFHVLGAGLSTEPSGPHALRVSARGGDVLEFVLQFDRGWWPAPHFIAAASVREESAAYWPKFWQSGGAIDFSGSRDPRAAELERRVVLSQYLTAIQCAGDFPPQESGLTNSTWFGKHHTEMMWWHGAHFALWGRDGFLEKNLDWYIGALPVARELARSRQLRGARWAKMIGPDGRESPGGNPLIVWNQPHPIHLAELLYRNAAGSDGAQRDTRAANEILQRYGELVLETAEGMASMLHWDEQGKRFNLGPPLWIAQEIYDQGTSMNPAYELSYWIRGLKIAQEWRERLNLGRNAEWDHRIQHIAKLPQKDGKYVAIESTPDTWDNKDSRHDHPSFLMALGQLPGDGVDRAVMARTLEATLAHWDWEKKIWGWDYPMIAMTAARLGQPDAAVDVLLKRGPNNDYMPNGHNRQREDLPVYLPGNGALLAAVAMMAAGWDDAPHANAPGFPQDGSWVVRSEGLRKLP